MNIVRDDYNQRTLFESDNLQDCVDWMLERKDQLDRHETYADEIDEQGNLLGWWSLDDLLWEMEVEE